MTRKVFQTALFVILILPACPTFEKSQKGVWDSDNVFEILHGQEYYCWFRMTKTYLPGQNDGKIYLSGQDDKNIFAGSE